LSSFNFQQHPLNDECKIGVGQTGILSFDRFHTSIASLSHFNTKTMALTGVTRGAVANEMGQGEEDISFVCQRCLQPLRINPSFYSMNEHTLADLSLPMSPAPEINLETGKRIQLKTLSN
jgi:hypothetical protein